MRRTPPRPCKPRRTVSSLDELPAICDVCDVAVYLKINPENVSKMARLGIINGAKIGQSWRFRKSDIIDYETRLFGGSGKEVS